MVLPGHEKVQYSKARKILQSNILYICIHTKKKETRKTVGLSINTEKGHGTKETMYYNVDRVEGTRKTKKRVQRQRDY